MLKKLGRPERWACIGTEAGGKTHTAFVFIKPHAVYEKAPWGI